MSILTGAIALNTDDPMNRLLKNFVKILNKTTIDISNFCYFVDTYLTFYPIDQIIRFNGGNIDSVSYMRLITFMIEYITKGHPDTITISLINILLNKYHASLNLGFDLVNEGIGISLVGILMGHNKLKIVKYLFGLGAYFPRVALIYAAQFYKKGKISSDMLYYLINKCPYRYINEQHRQHTVYNVSDNSVKAYLRSRFKNKLDMRTVSEIRHDETIIRMRHRYPEVMRVFLDNQGLLY